MVINVSLYTTNVLEKLPVTSTRMGLKALLVFFLIFFSSKQKTIALTLLLLQLNPQFTCLNLEDSPSTEVKW